MKKEINVSLVTTYFNAIKYILSTLESVYNQKLKNVNLEYIIVDDCSTDKTHTLVDSLICTNENITIKHIKTPENYGCGAARKYGIEHTTGDYIMFLDADDYFLNKDFIYRAANNIYSKKADIITYAVKFNSGNGSYNIFGVQKETNMTSREALLGLFLDNKIRFSVWDKIYSREIIDSFAYSTERTFEDVRTQPVWIFNAKKIICMPSVEINYRFAKNSIIHNDDLTTRLGTIKAITELFDYEQFKNDLELYKAFYRRATVDIFAIMNGKTDLNPGFNEMSKLNEFMINKIYNK